MKNDTGFLVGTVTHLMGGASPFVRVTRRLTRQGKSRKTSLTPNQKTISDAFVDARLNARGLAAYPGDLPATLTESYVIQDHSIARWPDRVGGWKIGLVPPEFRERAGAERLVGPIFEALIGPARAGRRHDMPVFAEGFAAVEAEFIFRLAADVPVGAEITDAYVNAVAGSLHVGAEIASSPFPGINDLGPTCVVSDFGNNFGLLVGPEIEDWSARDWSSLPAMVSINGREVGRATAADLPGGPIGALGFILRLMQVRRIALPAGSLISTGAVTGVHQAQVGDRALVDFGSCGRIDLSLTRLKPGWLDADRAAGASHASGG